MNEEEKKLPLQLKSCLFEARKSARYHQYRGSFHRAVATFINFLVLVSSSALFAGFLQIFQKDESLAWLGITASAAITFLTVLVAVVDFSGKSHYHYDLQRRYMTLGKDINSALLSPSRDKFDAVQKATIDIESEEKKIYRVLEAICFNEQVIADGDIASCVKIDPCQRFFSRIGDLWPHKIDEQPSTTSPAPSSPATLRKATTA